MQVDWVVFGVSLDFAVWGVSVDSMTLDISVDCVFKVVKWTMRFIVFQ